MSKKGGAYKNPREITNRSLPVLNTASAVRHCRMLQWRISSLHRWVNLRSSGVEQGFVGKRTRFGGRRLDFGHRVPLLEDTVQGPDIAGAFYRQLIGHETLWVCGEGSSPLADHLAFTLQILIQHVATEGRQVLC